MKKNQFMASATVFMITSFRPKKKKIIISKDSREGTCTCAGQRC